MERFKNILFYIDGMDELTPSLQRAVHLAQSNQARLTLIDVIQPVDTPAQIKARYNLELTDLLVSHKKTGATGRHSGVECSGRVDPAQWPFPPAQQLTGSHAAT